MSIDLFLNTAGRLASPAKGTGIPHTTAEKANGENQEQSEPAKLFGSLLEKPQSKRLLAGEQNDEVQSEDSDRADPDMPVRSPVYGVSQDLFPFAAGFNNPKDKDQPDTATKPSTNLSALADTTSAAKSENLVSSLPRSAATKDQQTDSTTDGSSESPQGELTLQSNNATEVGRPNVQPQPQPHLGKSAVVADVKAPAPAAPTAAARIADIQIVSERNFGAVKTLLIRLNPVELGAVTARIRLVADRVEVHLVADKARAAEALIADRAMIEKALKVAGISDDTKISVAVTERGAVSTVQHSSASQSAGHQQASSQQQGQQTFGMQNGSDGRENAQAQSQPQFMGGEGGQNGESGQTESNNARTRTSTEANEREISGLSGDWNRGLVV